MSEERKRGRRAPKEVTPASDKDIAICTAIILLELASADSPVSRFERALITNGIIHLFRVSEESAIFIVKEGENYLRNMTSSSLEAERLRAELNPAFLKVIGELMDKVICTDGEVSEMELYLRNRFRMILGLPEQKLAPLVK
jgi:uncharacterized tellurite resistance protein B-like protein